MSYPSVPALRVLDERRASKEKIVSVLSARPGSRVASGRARSRRERPGGRVLRGTVAVLGIWFGLLCVACNPKPRHDSESDTAESSVNGAEPAGPAARAEGATATATTSSSSGRKGTVSGTVTVSGDAPPVIESVAPKIPVGKCFAAHETYSKLFREGPNRTLADVLVAVTEYQGQPEPRGDVVELTAADCAYDRRTIAMTLGQTLHIKNKGKETYTPELLGLRTKALILSIPGGDPVEYKPLKPGQYQLVDRTHPFIFSDVMVLSYPTTAVTGLDGKFRIDGLPPGKAKLSALLPITGQSISKVIEIPEGGNVEVNLTFEFDAERDGEKAHAQPATP